MVLSGAHGSRYDGRTWTTFNIPGGPAFDTVWSLFQDREGVLWFGNARNGVSRYDGRTWTTFTKADGLADDQITAIGQDREGTLWFGGCSSLSQYDSRTWTTFTTQDGLADNSVGSIFQDRDGHLWFTTRAVRGGGVSRYDGKTFTTFTAQDGLWDNSEGTIFQDREGVLWFGIGGVTRYDRAGRRSGESSGMGTWTTFTTRDGLAHNEVRSILQDREGVLWFATFGGGVSRFDPRIEPGSEQAAWTTFTTEDGLPDNRVFDIFQDRQGHFWFGTPSGIIRFDEGRGRSGSGVGRSSSGGDRSSGSMEGWTTEGRTSGEGTWTAFPGDGWTLDWAYEIFQDREGVLWFGTAGGVRRFDGQAWTTLTPEDGLASNMVPTIFQDREGHIWFDTFGGGVSRYDGRTFQTLTQQDGLGSNSIRSIYEDRDGNIWFATDGGVTRYRRPAPSPPAVSIHTVTADRRYTGISELSLSSPAGLVSFEFTARSFKTRPGQIVYRYRLKGYDQEWKTTRERRVEYQDIPRGSYTFEVEAVDRDLTYSKEPATVTLRVHLPYERIGLLSALSIALALVAWQSIRVLRRDKLLQVSNAALSSAN